MAFILDENIVYLKGVGPQRAKLLLEEADIRTFSDLAHYYPYKYVDRTLVVPINQLNENMGLVQVHGRITKKELVGQKRQQRLVVSFFDGTGSVVLVWFKGVASMYKYLNINAEYIVFGKPVMYNRAINFTHPEIEEKTKNEAKPEFKLQAFYNTSEKMKQGFLTSKAIHLLQINLFNALQGKIPETLPAWLIAKQKLLTLSEALFQIHLPKSEQLLNQAKHRLKFEELFFIQMRMLYLKSQRKSIINGLSFKTVGNYFNGFYANNLPFELTGAQKRVLREIRIDTNSGKQMNRLLQGDVGSGKTVVAFMSMLLAIDNGFQACLMAPTEILANQHLKTIGELASNLGLNIGLLTGSTRKKQRTLIHEQLANGEMHIIIGTHALIEETVVFSNLGLVVVDEQHRFGVAQRAKLWAKNDQPPHVLVMTATPIPRTLAMTLYGDLDVSVIDELPPGRKAIVTKHQYDSHRLQVFGFMRDQIKLGRQIYIVYPLIKESEALDYKDLEDGLESISRAFPPPEYAISVMHGKMKAEEKDKSMALFLRHQTQIMIATTVIEVGVNVPNASVMVIESAERFGLSQLHQLRGRVGRGADQSYCILMTSPKLSAEARTRLQTMVRTNDGFEIAETDLKLRGPGDIDGTQQSGVPIDLKIANIARDGQLIQLARNQATEILEADPTLSEPQNQILKLKMNQKTVFETDWGKIS